MKRMMKKLRSRAGESIAEVLISTLIAAVALVLLASMITSASNLIRSSENNVNAYYASGNVLAEQAGSPSGNPAVTFSGPALEPGKNTITVDCYENEGGKVASYRFNSLTYVAPEAANP